jgi:RimJ/RimL family protein N-acetyltransferase
MVKLATTRFELSLMTLEEKGLMFELDQDEAVMKYINGGHKTTMEQIETHFMPRVAKYLNPDKGWGLWKVMGNHCQENIDDNLAGQYLGWILVRPMGFFTDNPQFDDIELGWRFKQICWGKGTATEAARAVVDYLATKDEVNYVSAIAAEDNLGSIKVMQKLGMAFHKKAPEPEGVHPGDVVYYRRKV